MVAALPPGSVLDKGQKSGAREEENAVLAGLQGGGGGGNNSSGFLFPAQSSARSAVRLQAAFRSLEGAAAATPAAQGLELHASTSSLGSGESEGRPIIRLAEEYGTASRSHGALESQADDEEEEEEHIMLKALQVYPAPEKDDSLQAAGTSSPVRSSRAFARSDDEGAGFGFSQSSISPPSSPVPTSEVSFQHPSQLMPETPVQRLTQEPSCFSEQSHRSSELFGDDKTDGVTEPEPSAVAAKLKKAALAGSQQEQTLEELLSLMGVSLTRDQDSLDYSYALEYHRPPIAQDETGFSPKNMGNSTLIDSLPVAKPLEKASWRGFKLQKPLDTQVQRNPASTSRVARLLRGEWRTSMSGSETALVLPTDIMVAESVRPQEGLSSQITSFPVSQSAQEGIAQPAAILPAAQSSEDLLVQQLKASQQDLSSIALLEHGQSTLHSDLPEDSLEPQVAVDESHMSSEVSSLNKPKDNVMDSAPSCPLESTDIGQKRAISYFAHPPDSPASTSSAATIALIDASEHSRKSSSSDIGEILASASASFSASPSIASSLSEPLALSYYVKGKGTAMAENISGSSSVPPEMLASLVHLGKPSSLMDQPAYDSPQHSMATSPRASEPAGASGNILTLFPPQDRKKGGCYGCGKNRRLQDKEVCMVCRSKFCRSCILYMGSMPEGRKCVGCIGQPIHETRRPFIGKPSRLLKHMLSPQEVQQIMKAEIECPANQLRPEQVWVNGSKLSSEEMAMLLNSAKPPQKLKPGRFWYDGQTGLWGKEGHRPDKIISTSLKVGGSLQSNASKGTTQVFMNGRELGKLELKMLKLAGVHCPPNTHLWVENDGRYSEEGFNNVRGNIWGKEGNIWKKASIKLLYPFFSLPTPGSSSRGNNERANGVSNRFPNYLEQSKAHKLLLLGHEGSGRSTIFKQAKILYNDGFTKEEKANFKSLIQTNIYKYMRILLEGREHFEEEEDDLAEIRALSQLSASAPSCAADNSDLPSQSAGMFTWNEKKERKSMSRKGKSVFAMEARLKQVSDRFLEKMAAESLESGFPSSSYTQEFAPIVEELWNNPAIKAVYDRRAVLYSLPNVASYYLDRVVEVSKTEYEPTENDILQAEGLSQGSGLVQIEFDLEDKVPNSGAWQDNESPLVIGRYQLIRVGGRGSDRQRWLDMFEDVRAIIFCVALSDYDALWPDSSGTLCNKMVQTRDFFNSVLKHPCFQDTRFVLLLNKYDLFEDKITRGIPLTSCEWFSDFSPVHTQNQAQQAYQYIVHKYKELNRDRKLFTFQLNALEKTTVSHAFQYVRETLKYEEHQTTGFGLLHEDLSYSTDASSFSQHSLARQAEVYGRDGKRY